MQPDAHPYEEGRRTAARVETPEALLVIFPQADQHRLDQIVEIDAPAQASAERGAEPGSNRRFEAPYGAGTSTAGIGLVTVFRQPLLS